MIACSALPRVVGIIAVAAMCSGCASFKRGLENRITTTLSGDRAFVTSVYGPLGFTAELSAEDAAELYRMRELARFAESLISAQRAAAAAQPKSTNP